MKMFINGVKKYISEEHGNYKVGIVKIVFSDDSFIERADYTSQVWKDETGKPIDLTWIK